MADSKQQKNPEHIWEEKSRPGSTRQASGYRIPSPGEVQGQFDLAELPHQMALAVAKVKKEKELNERLAEIGKRSNVAHPNFTYMGKPLNGLARWFKPGETVNLCGYTVTCGHFFVGEWFSTGDKSYKPGLIRPSRVVQAAKTKFEQNYARVIPASSIQGSETQIFFNGYENLDAVTRDLYLQWLANDRMGTLQDPVLLLVFLAGVERFAVQAHEHKNASMVDDFPSAINEIERLIDANSHREWIALELAKKLSEFMKTICVVMGITGFNTRYHLVLSNIAAGWGSALVNERYLTSQRVYAEMALCLKEGKDIPPELIYEVAKSASVQVAADVQFLENPMVHQIILSHFKTIALVNRRNTSYIPSIGNSNMLITYQSPTTFNLRISTKGLPNVIFNRNQKDIHAEDFQNAAKQVQEGLTLLFAGEPPDSIDVLTALPGPHCWPKEPEYLHAIRQGLPNPPVPMRAGDLLSLLGSKELTRHMKSGIVTLLNRYRIGLIPGPAYWRDFPETQVVPYAIPTEDGIQRAPYTRTTTMRADCLTLLISALYLLFQKAEIPREDIADRIGHIVREVACQDNPVLFAWVQATTAHLLCSNPRTLTYLEKQAAERADQLPAYGFVGGILSFFREHMTYPAILLPMVVKLLAAVEDSLPSALKMVGHTQESYDLLTRKQPKPKKPKQIAAAEPEVPFVVTLDHSKVAAIEQETGEVAALMAGIFNEDEASPAQARESEPAVVEKRAAVLDPHADQPRLLGLSTVHSKLLATMLASGDVISRSTYLGFCSALGILPDSALEAINEAGFEVHGMAIYEGEDPMERNPDITL